MIKTTDVVRKVFLDSDTAQLAAGEGLLNVSAFSRKIQPLVEKNAKKQVSVGTINVALYRLLESYLLGDIKPKVTLEELTIHGHLVAFTYPKTTATLKCMPALIRKLLSATNKPFYTVTQGPQEITLIADQSLSQVITEELGSPHTSYKDLVALSVTFSPQYLEVPNMMYTLFSSLAVKRINVMEIVSTLTSLTFVIHFSQLHRTIHVLKKHLHT